MENRVPGAESFSTWSESPPLDMCHHEWEIVRLSAQSVGARLTDGTVVDLQAAHVALHGTSSPHLQSAFAFRLSASYGNDLAHELIASMRAGA